MKAVFLLLLINLSAVCAFPDLENLYRERLQKSVEYRQALLQLEQAKLALRQTEGMYIPYIDLSAGGMQGGGITVANGELLPLSVEMKATFANVFGTDIFVSLPFHWNTEEGPAFEFPRFSISRKLIVQTTADLLSARAAFLQGEEKVESARLSIWQDLIRDITDAYFYFEARYIQERYLSVIERQMEATKDEQRRRSLQKQWYAMRKNYLDSSSSVSELSPGKSDLNREAVSDLIDEIKAYTLEVEREADRLERAGDFDQLFPAIQETDKTLISLALAADAAKREAALWFLPYVPNPEFSAGLTYDIDAGALDWSISIGLAVPVVDRGERAYQALARKESAAIAELKLDQARNNYITERQKAWNTREILEIDRALAEIEAEETRETRKEAELLYKAGYLSEEDFMAAELEQNLAELSVLRSSTRFLLHLLDMLQMSGTALYPEEE